MNKMVTGQMCRSILFLVIALLTSPLQAECFDTIATRIAPDSRYQDNANGTVTDLKTGLMWMKCMEGVGADCGDGLPPFPTHTWTEALQRVSFLNTNGFAGYSDWRLPNIKELESLVDTACDKPAINSTFFPKMPGTGPEFLSSSPGVTEGINDGYVWLLSFQSGSTRKVSMNRGSGTFPLSGLVRLVRGGQ